MQLALQQIHPPIFFCYHTLLLNRKVDIPELTLILPLPDLLLPVLRHQLQFVLSLRTCPLNLLDFLGYF